MRYLGADHVEFSVLVDSGQLTRDRHSANELYCVLDLEKIAVERLGR